MAQLIGLAYNSLKREKNGETQIRASRLWQANQRKKVKTERQVLPLTACHGPSAIPDRFTGAALIIKPRGER